MNTLREDIIEKVVELELFHTHTTIHGKGIPTYVLEGFDKERIEAEGSTHIVYVYDCVRQYYLRHKEDIENSVDKALWNAIEKQERFGRNEA